MEGGAGGGFQQSLKGRCAPRRGTGAGVGSDGAASGGDIPGRQRDLCGDPWPENTRCDCGGKKRASVTVRPARRTSLDLSARPDLGASPRVSLLEEPEGTFSRLARTPDDST